MPLFPPRNVGGLGAQMEQPQAGGLGGFLGNAFGGLSRFNDQRPELLMLVGSMLRGDDPWQAIAYGQSRRKTRAAEAETKRILACLIIRGCRYGSLALAFTDALLALGASKVFRLGVDDLARTLVAEAPLGAEVDLLQAARRA